MSVKNIKFNYMDVVALRLAIIKELPEHAQEIYEVSDKFIDEHVKRSEFIKAQINAARQK